MEESRMIRSWPLGWVAAFFVSASLTPALVAAQTLIVRQAPPGGVVEVAVGSDVAGSATADSLGDATVSLKTFPRQPAVEMSTQVFLDVCGTRRRVILVERSFQPPAVPDDCIRRAVAGFFVLRPVSTLVIEVGEVTPIVRIRQGPAPEAWLRHGPPPPPSLFTAAPGLELFGGANFVTFRDAVGRSCGTLQGCSGKDFTPAYAMGAAYWVSPYFGAHASYLRAGTVKVSGTGAGYVFDTDIDVEALTISGIAGAPIGRSRLYGFVGMNRHRAAYVTTETTEDAVVVENGVPRTILGGTEVFVLNTAGWGWQFGGGFDVWVRPMLAFFGEAGSGPIKGSNQDAPEGQTDDHITFLLVGARVRLSGFGR
jgi:hypothetical protein